MEMGLRIERMGRAGVVMMLMLEMERILEGAGILNIFVIWELKELHLVRILEMRFVFKRMQELKEVRLVRLLVELTNGEVVWI